MIMLNDNQWRKDKIKIRQYFSLLKSPNFDASNVVVYSRSTVLV